MKSSIRKFLLINLLLAITITTTLTAIGNYYLDEKDIHEHLDTLLAISALSYQALLGNDLKQRPLHQIQDNLEIIPKKIDQYSEKNFFRLKGYLDRFNFQVWSDGGKLLLHSPTAPKIPLIADADGFNDVIISKKKWRVFTTYNEKVGARTVVAERDDTRKELGHLIAQDDIYIMLLTFPLSGLLIWIIIGRGLDSLDRVAKEVANRAPTNLKSVNLEGVPEEIKPVIDELNKLFNRLHEGLEREKRFAADAAHELKTPLASIKAQAQVALNSNNIEEKNIALQKLIVNVNRSTHVVQQLLTISRWVPDSPEIKNFEEINLARITRDILAIFAPSALDKHIELEFEEDNTLSNIMGNAIALSILIRNILVND